MIIYKKGDKCLSLQFMFISWLFPSSVSPSAGNSSLFLTGTSAFSYFTLNLLVFFLLYVCSFRVTLPPFSLPVSFFLLFGFPLSAWPSMASVEIDKFQKHISAVSAHSCYRSLKSGVSPGLSRFLVDTSRNNSVLADFIFKVTERYSPGVCWVHFCLVMSGSTYVFRAFALA